jgi:hypothetical protein
VYLECVFRVATLKGAIRYRHKLNRRFDHNNTKAAGAEPMSHNWEMVE